MLQKLARECLAGLTVAVVALPLAIAFGIAATGTSEGALVGLYGAIFSGFFAALFGGTKGQVTGPTGPITVVATGVIAKYGLDVSFIVFILAGCFQILFGIIKIGSYIKYIPYSVVSGFMNGIALIIILGELKQVKLSFLIVAVTIMIMLFSRRWITVIPSSLVALVVVTFLVILSENLIGHLTINIPFFGEVALVNSIHKIGTIPEAIPSLHIPNIELGLILPLIFPAISIALLGSIDSLLTSVVMDQVTGQKHKSNKELIGQGIGNIASGLFGGLAGAGATVRSIVNIKSGGKTALSACVHSVVLLILVIGLGSAVQYIPLPVLSGILIFTGFGMFDWDGLKKIMVTPKIDVIVMLVTMILTVVFDLILAVGVGIALSLVYSFIVNKKRQKLEIIMDDQACCVSGPLSFLTVSKIENLDTNTFNLKDVTYLDLTGAMGLLQYAETCFRTGNQLVLVDVPQFIQNQLSSLANKDQKDAISFQKAVEKIG